MTESDSPPDTLNHHKVIQGQSGGPESGHHRGLSAFSPSQHPQYRPHPLIILDGYLLVYPRCCLVTPPPHVWCVSASLQSDLVTSLLSVSPLSGLDPQTQSHKLSIPASAVNNLNKVARQHWKGHTADNTNNFMKSSRCSFDYFDYFKFDCPMSNKVLNK